MNKRIYNSDITLGGKMEIINSSVVTLDEIVGKTVGHLNRRRGLWITFIMAIVFGVIMLAFHNWIIGIALIVVDFILICLNVHVNNRILKQLRTDNDMMGKGIYFEYIFKDKHFQVGSVYEGHNSIDNINYDALLGARVFGDIMFLYITSNDAYIVKKSGFKNEEDWGTLIKHLQEKNLLRIAN